MEGSAVGFTTLPSRFAQPQSDCPAVTNFMTCLPTFVLLLIIRIIVALLFHQSQGQGNSRFDPTPHDLAKPPKLTVTGAFYVPRRGSSSFHVPSSSLNWHHNFGAKENPQLWEVAGKLFDRSLVKSYVATPKPAILRMPTIIRIATIRLFCCIGWYGFI